MKNICISVSLMFIASCGIYAQESGDNLKVIEVPSKHQLIFLMHQPSAPLKLEDVQLFTDSKGTSPKIRYLVKNPSAKAVVSFSIGFRHSTNITQWAKFGDGWSETVGRKQENLVIIPAAGTYENAPRVRLAPVTNEVLNILTAGDLSRRIVVMGYLKHVAFSDGSEFTADEVEDEIENFLLSSK